MTAEDYLKHAEECERLAALAELDSNKRVPFCNLPRCGGGWQPLDSQRIGQQRTAIYRSKPRSSFRNRSTTPPWQQARRIENYSY